MGIKSFIRKVVILRKHASSIKLQRGFTLIELLVVIGILGILAAALIATIDPFEQLKKANDTTSRNTAAEFVSAITRYYGNRNAYPWDPAPSGAGCNSGQAPLATAPMKLDSAAGLLCIDALITEGELKSGFKNSTNVLKTINITGGSTAITMSACYLPTSKTGQKDLNAKYTISGGPGTTCKSYTPAGSTDCYVCLQ